LAVPAAAVLADTLALVVQAALVAVTLMALGQMALAVVVLAVAAPQSMAQAVLVVALDCLALGRTELPIQRSVGAAAAALVAVLAEPELALPPVLEALSVVALVGQEMVVIHQWPGAAALSASFGLELPVSSHRPIRGTCNA
jgi:hypothetical protein